ncbi:hypothetical protein AN394_03821 [Pseudoalteromonas sp. P1-26]|nr:hypothetical protein AN394_03821 [Pseudoalteromonas sp. P1-26]
MTTEDSNVQVGLSGIMRKKAFTLPLTYQLDTWILMMIRNMQVLNLLMILGIVSSEVYGFKTARNG